ncbi:MAG: ABC transporter substrate-binding protein [Acidimicrobiia bacterium]|nr:ABC transporter substrate-binding protein [Acidimicrobiia bacterium]
MKTYSRNRSRRTYGVLLLVLALFIAACGGNGGGDDQAAEGDTQAPETTEAPQTTEAEPTDAPESTSGETEGPTTTGAESTEGASAESEPVVLGGAVDQTAYLVDFDGPVITGVELAVQAINDEGGVLEGRPLEVSFQDMQADPQQGVRVVQRFITEENVTALVHGFTSASTRAVQPILSQNEVPMIAASVLPEDEAFVFTTIPPAVFETGARVQYLADQGISNVGVMHDGTPYNELQLEVLTEGAGEAGLTIVGTEQHASDAVDLRPQVTALLQAGAEAVVKLSAGPTNIVAAQAMSQSNTDAPLIIGIDTLQTHQQAAAAYENYLTVGSGPQVFEALSDDQKSDSLIEFMELYEESGQTDVDPTYMGRGWDATRILAQAIDAAGSTEGQAIATALEELEPFEGASGTYDFTAESHYAFDENPFHVVRFTDDGSVEIVFTPES